jgi:hypothetical protein
MDCISTVVWYIIGPMKKGSGGDEGGKEGYCVVR